MHARSSAIQEQYKYIECNYCLSLHIILYGCLINSYKSTLLDVRNTGAAT